MGSAHPELVSDGRGLPFSPLALVGAYAALDREDPAVGALLSHLTARVSSERAAGMPWKRSDAPAVASLNGWRVLARGEKEVLFGIGVPPRLLTITARQSGLRRRFSCAGPNAASSLRAMRDGIRASSWRLDPTYDVQPGHSTLRVLVTEQAFASGQRAEGRILPPDIYIDDDELLLTVFVTPRAGFQTATKNPETPVRVMLPVAVGSRRLIDGADGRFAPASV
jgi:hypothetical protein